MNIEILPPGIVCDSRIVGMGYVFDSPPRNSTIREKCWLFMTYQVFNASRYLSPPNIAWDDNWRTTGFRLSAARLSVSFQTLNNVIQGMDATRGQKKKPHRDIQWIQVNDVSLMVLDYDYACLQNILSRKLPTVSWFWSQPHSYS